MFLSTCPAFQLHQQQLRQFDFTVERFKTNGEMIQVNFQTRFDSKAILIVIKILTEINFLTEEHNSPFFHALLFVNQKKYF